MSPRRWLAVRIGRTQWLVRRSARVVKVDQALRRISGGRLTLLGLAGVPEVFLTVPGRHSGVPRTTPLVGVPSNGGWLVATADLGSSEPPAWATNLVAAGRAHVEYRGRHTTVVPRRLDGEERAGAWQQLLRTWPPFATYAERADHEPQVFFLAPAR